MHLLNSNLSDLISQVLQKKTNNNEFNNNPLNLSQTEVVFTPGNENYQIFASTQENESDRLNTLVQLKIFQQQVVDGIYYQNISKA